MNEIILGDANELIKNIPDKSVDLIYTDIPYLYDNGGGGYSELSKRIIKMKDGLSDAGIDKGISYDIFYDFIRVCKKINIFIWCSKLQIFDIWNWFTSHCPDLNYEILVWCKSNPTPMTNNVWLPDLEYCLYFREKGVRLNPGYELKHKYYYSGLNVNDKNDYNHPTVKPYEFVEKNILHTTKPGDVILDPYLGSGTSCLAAKQNNRNYIGFEINPEFYKIAVDRLNGINQRGEIDLLNYEQLDLFGGEEN